MELDAGTAETYLRLALSEMLEVVDRLGDERVNQRPFGESTNSIAALVTHSCAVGEWWLGHIGLGRPSDRVRDDEFGATATTAELRALIETSMDQVSADVYALDAGERSDEHRALAHTLEHGDDSDGSLVLHVLEELYQHLGHMELTADALTSRS